MRYESHSEAITSGMVAAWKTYHQWSGRHFVHDAGIEAFLSVKVAEQLITSFPDTCRVQLEARVSDLVEYSGAENTRGRVPAALRSGGRVDIAFFDRKDRLTGVIEVKRHMNASIHKSDARRLTSMLERIGVARGGSLRWGALAAMHTIWKSNKVKVDDRLQRAAETLKAEVRGRRVYTHKDVFMLPEPIIDEDNEFLGCAGLCILIT